MRFARVLLLFPLMSLLAAEVPLVLHNPAGVASASSALTVSVPFPRGQLQEVSGLRLVDRRTGAVLPAQVRQLNRWPQDGSVQWVMLDARGELDGQVEQALLLRTDGQGPAPAFVRPLQVREDAESLTVSTGVAEFVMGKKHFDLFESIRVNGTELLVTGERLPGLYLRHADGELFASRFGPADGVTLEEAGEARAVVRAEGWYYSQAGKPFCRYLTRLHFYQGQAVVRQNLTLVITESSETARFRDIAVAVPLAHSQFRWGGEDAASPALSGSRYLLQYDHDKYLTGDSAAPSAWRPEGEGRRAPGWVGAVTAAGGQALLHVRNFWQEFPNELEVRAGSALVYHLWPAHGVSQPERGVTDANRQYLWFCHEGEVLDFKVPEHYYRSPTQNPAEEYALRYVRSAANESCLGVAKSVELTWDFAVSGPVAAQAALMETPVTVMASPEWLCSSGVFGWLSPARPQEYPVEEGALAGLFDCERRLQDHTGDYGKFNYGDSHTAWNYETGRWDDAYRCWRGYHHCSGTVPWILYIRTGERKYLDWAIANARHLMDIDMCNWTNETFAQLPYPKGKVKGGLCDYKGLSHWHAGNRLMDYNCMTGFMIYYYYFTGDRRGLEVAEMWGEAVLEAFKSPFEGRSGAGVASALLDLYQATGEKKYFAVAETLVQFMLKTQNDGEGRTFGRHTLSYVNVKGKAVPNGAFSSQGGWENYAPWLEKYIDLTGDAEAQRRMVLWADAYAEGYGDTASIWRTGADCLNVLSYAYRISGNPRYLEYGRFYLDYYLNGIVRKPGDLMDGFGTIAQTSLGFDYVSLRLPIFLAGLHAHGQPVSARFVGGGLHNVHSQQPEVFIRNGSGAGFTLIGGASCASETEAMTLQVLAPDGSVAAAQELKGAGYHRFALPVPAGAAGVYRSLLLGNRLQHFDVDVQEPLAWVYRWNGEPAARAGGMQFYFQLPAGSRELAVSLAGAYGDTGNSWIELMDAAGNRVAAFGKGTQKVALPAAAAAQVWGVRGIFGKRNQLAILVDGRPVPPYLATQPGRYFNPEE